ncbi:MAG: guanylate kinase [Elusimicrobia bacterium]|nr:guanylate kinase [Elusimicrobiota bacterium]
MGKEKETVAPGILLVLSAPLGVGKRTLCQALLDRHPDARLSISKTTRPRGPREVEGYDFYFVSEPEFKQQIAAGEFLEYVQIDGHFYGTPRPAISENLAAGRDVILDVDTEGSRAVKTACPESLLVFVSPASSDTLEARLKSLDSGRPEELPRRLAHAREEIAHAAEYDFVVLSDTLVETAEEISAILRAEHCRAARVAARINGLLR